MPVWFHYLVASGIGRLVRCLLFAKTSPRNRAYTHVHRISARVERRRSPTCVFRFFLLEWRVCADRCCVRVSRSPFCVFLFLVRGVAFGVAQVVLMNRDEQLFLSAMAAYGRGEKIIE